MQMIKIDDPLAISTAQQVIEAGGIAAFPTDTIYGIGASAYLPAAIDRIYAIKGRDLSKSIPVLIGSMEQLSVVVSEFNEIAQRLAERFWPGPLTIVLPKHPDLPANLSTTETIGVRFPAHPFIAKMITQMGPLAVTSANLSGGENTLTAQDVVDQLGDRLDLILDGGSTPGPIPSTVVSCLGSDYKILRHGVISASQIDVLFS